MLFGYVLFAIVVVIQPIAQMLEKHGVSSVGRIGAGDLLSLSLVLKLVTNPFIAAGVVLSVVGLFLWLAVLSHFKLNYIYPFGAVSYIVLAVLSYVFLGETITMVRGLGICVIVLGCIMINL